MGIPIGDLERVREIDKDDNLVLGRGETNKAMKANASQLADFVNKELLPEKEQREQELDNYINQIKEDVKEKSDEANAEIEKVVEEQTGLDWEGVGEDLDNLHQLHRDNKSRIEKVKNTFTDPFEKSEYNETNLTDTDSTFIKDLKAYGDSWKSKNLLECIDIKEIVNNGVTFTPVYKDGKLQYINANGTATGNGDYWLSGKVGIPSGTSVKFSGLPSEQGENTIRYVTAPDWGMKLNESEHSGGVDGIYLQVVEGFTCNNLKIYPMIRLASVTDSTYEPYGLHTIEELNFDVCGKNLLDGDLLQGTYGTDNIFYDDSNYVSSKNYSKVNSNETYTISSSKQGQIWVIEYDASNNLLSRENKGVGFNATFTTSENTRKVKLMFGGSATPHAINDNNKYQLEKGSATPYTPYSGTSFKITPPRPLCKIGDIVDVLDVENGEWRYGTTLEELRRTTNGLSSAGGLGWVDLSIPFNENVISDKFTMKKSGSDGWYSTAPCMSEGEGHIRVYGEKNTSYTFKLCYPLATPKTEPINSNDLSLLKTLQTYSPETNISITDQNGNEIDREFLYSSGAVGYAVDAGTVNGRDLCREVDVNLFGKPSKNLLETTLQTTTKNGVTCTRNEDGTFTLNGTASPTAEFTIGNIDLDDGFYRLVGTPNGGKWGDKFGTYAYNGDYSVSATDGGNGTNLQNDTSQKFNVGIVIFNGFTANNLVFKPMITTDLNATYSDYEPHIKSNLQLTNDLSSLIALLKSKNVI